MAGRIQRTGLSWDVGFLLGFFLRHRGGVSECFVRLQLDEPVSAGTFDGAKSGAFIDDEIPMLFNRILGGTPRPPQSATTEFALGKTALVMPRMIMNRLTRVMGLDRL